jgi:hypothetical protein
MNEFIDKNKRLLRFYFFTARVAGWFLVIGGCVWLPYFLSGKTWRTESIDHIMYGISSLLFDFVFPGLIALIVARFIRYVYDTESKPGMILKCASGILYLYAAVLIGNALLNWYVWRVLLMRNVLEGQGDSSLLLFIQPILLPVATKVLIIVGLGQVLGRLLPVIEESKMLV